MELIAHKMTANELRKAALLILKAADLEMNVSSYGEAAVNQSSGNVYLWLEDYPFSLYIAPSGGDRIHACWSNPENGEEETIDADNMTRRALETWAEALQAQADEDA